MHLFFDTVPEETKNTMEISEFKCMTCGTAITKGEYDTFVVCDACYNANYKKQTEASGSVAAPTWYTENEMYHWLIRNNYHENIARELSSKWAADLQGAFNKGFEKGTRELKEREEALKELIGVAKNYLDLDKMANPKSIEAIIGIATFSVDSIH